MSLSPVKKLIDLMIVIVVMADTPEALDVVPAGPPEERRVDTGVAAHRPVRQVVNRPKLGQEINIRG